IRPGLEIFNQDANTLRLAEGKGTLSYKGAVLFEGDIFRAQLSGVCTKAEGDTEVNLRHLYEETSRYTSGLPHDFRVPFNESRDELMYHIIALRSKLDTIRQYCQSGRYSKDPKLEDAYRYLTQCVQHFEAIGFQQQRLADLRQQLVRESNPALVDLEKLTLACRSIILGIKANDAMKVRLERFSLAQSITDAASNQTTRLGSLKKIGLDYDQGKVVYGHILDYGRQILSRTEEFLNRKPASPAYLNYPDAYYYYNERLLSLFNHRKYGLLAYYNRYLRFASMPQPLHLEMAPSFTVIPPIKNKPQPSKEDILGELLLEAPANHLVFLVDVSSSMQKPEKMALLREGLLDLIKDLRPEDHLSIVAFAARPDVVVKAASAVRKAYLSTAIKSLQARGETNLVKGMKTAFDLASDYFIPEGNNRVILVSDGDFILKSGTERYIRRQASGGTHMSIFLMSKFASETMEENLRQLAEAGEGEYTRVAKDNIREVMLREAQLLRVPTRSP
ncbi:MAG: VWA domain-containing protein, partial [Bacteroidota bacterium]